VASPYRAAALASLERSGAAPITVRVYDKLGRRVGWVGRPLEVRCTLRDPGVSTATMSVELDHDLGPALQADGARVEVDLDDGYLMGGWRGPVRTTGGPTGVLAVDVIDDSVVLADLLGWQVPTAPLSAQTREHDVRRGPAETVLKGLLRANAQRAPVAVQVAPDQGRGPQVVVEVRMRQLDEVFAEVLERSDLMVRVTPTGAEQQRTGLLVDVVPRPRYPHVLDEVSGDLVDVSTETIDSTATRVVVGGGGEGTDRDFRGPFVDTARETRLRRKIERFVDARAARSELDEATRAVESATAAAFDARHTLRDAQVDRRASILEKAIDVNKAQREVDVLPSTATQAERDAAAAALERARKSLDETTTSENAKVSAATTALDKATAQRAAAVATQTTERAAYEAELVRRGEQALTDAEGTTSVAASITENPSLRYGVESFVVGARLPLALAGSQDETPIYERMRQAELTWTPGEGLAFTGKAGDRPQDAKDPLASTYARLVQAVSQLSQRTRAMNRR